MTGLVYAISECAQYALICLRFLVIGCGFPLLLEDLLCHEILLMINHMFQLMRQSRYNDFRKLNLILLDPQGRRNV